MGARQSKRSVDITTTPKKGEAEGSPVNEDKIEKLGDADVVEVVTNGTTAHTDIEFVVSFTLIFFCIYRTISEFMPIFIVGILAPSCRAREVEVNPVRFR